ncbi:hypothetical protein XarjCFBP7645_06050 [Xanthomonas arboricola]|uniref:Uncharacterized protein n=1 Tax=Xanthomonas arboricola TaxID=56448 RepID=A0A2S7AIT8_9XANT|nr:hypothetical protein XarjCFBP7645_06050 [Xanthomonas arboricola]
MRSVGSWLGCFGGGRTLTPTPAPRPSPRQRRGRSKARAPVARNQCLIAPGGAGLWCVSGKGLCASGHRACLGCWMSAPGRCRRTGRPGLGPAPGRSARRGCRVRAWRG